MGPGRVDWGAVEGDGMPGVVVKCVEIRRNTGGEGGLLGRGPTLRRESVGSEPD